MNKKRGGVLILFYFNAFNMYKIYLKYFTLKLANSLLLKKHHYLFVSAQTQLMQLSDL